MLKVAEAVNWEVYVMVVPSLVPCYPGRQRRSVGQVSPGSFKKWNGKDSLLFRGGFDNDTISSIWTKLDEEKKYDII